MPSRPRWSTGAAVMQWVVTRLRAGKADWICLFFMAYAWFFQLRQKMLSSGFSCLFITIYLTVFHFQLSWSALPHRGFESSHACMHTEYAGIYTRKKTLLRNAVFLIVTPQLLCTRTLRTSAPMILIIKKSYHFTPWKKHIQNHVYTIITISAYEKSEDSPSFRRDWGREREMKKRWRERKKSRDKTKMRNGVGEEVIIYYLLRL